MNNQGCAAEILISSIVGAGIFKDYFLLLLLFFVGGVRIYRLFAEYLLFARLFFSQGRKQWRLFKDSHREHRWCVSLHLLRAREDCVGARRGTSYPGVSRNVQRECYSIVYGGRLHKQGRFHSL